MRTLHKFWDSDSGEVGSEYLNLPEACRLVAYRLSHGLPAISIPLPLAHFSRGRVRRERAEPHCPSFGKYLASWPLWGRWPLGWPTLQPLTGALMKPPLICVLELYPFSVGESDESILLMELT